MPILGNQPERIIALLKSFMALAEGRSTDLCSQLDCQPSRQAELNLIVEQACTLADCQQPNRSSPSPSPLASMEFHSPWLIFMLCGALIGIIGGVGGTMFLYRGRLARLRAYESSDSSATSRLLHLNNADDDDNDDDDNNNNN
jgi:hypothetical protein